MIERFLRYSLEREKKIQIVLSRGGALERLNVRVVAMDESGFEAIPSGRKRPARYALSDVLTAAYARGDAGELEE